MLKKTTLILGMGLFILSGIFAAGSSTTAADIKTAPTVSPTVSPTASPAEPTPAEPTPTASPAEPTPSETPSETPAQPSPSPSVSPTP